MRKYRNIDECECKSGNALGKGIAAVGIGCAIGLGIVLALKYVSKRIDANSHWLDDWSDDDDSWDEEEF